MGQKSSVPLQTTVAGNNNPARPPAVSRKPPAPIPPYRIHSFVIPENKVLPTGVAPRRLRPVSAELATRNSDFASIWGNPVTALDEHIRDSLQKESLDRHAANLASIIAGTEAKSLAAKKEAVASTAVQNMVAQTDQITKVETQGQTVHPISKLTGKQSTSQDLDHNLNSKPEKSDDTSSTPQIPNVNSEILTGSAKESLERASSMPSGFRTNWELLPSGGLPQQFSNHRRNASTSTFSSQPILPEDAEDISSFASDTFSRTSNTSLPQKCSFNIDRTQSLTYAQLAEMRRQNSPLGSLDLNSRAVPSGAKITPLPYRNAEVDLSVKSVDRRPSRKKKRAPDPPSLARPFSLSSQDVREQSTVLGVLPELESPTKVSPPLAEPGKAKVKVPLAEPEVTDSEPPPPPPPKWFTAASSGPSSKPSLMSDPIPCFAYKSLITPISFKSEQTRNLTSHVSAPVPAYETNYKSLTKTTTTVSSVEEKSTQNELSELKTTENKTSTEVMSSPKLTEVEPAGNWTLLSREDTSTTSPKEEPVSDLPADTTVTSNSIASVSNSSAQLQSFHPDVPPPLASSESYEVSVSPNEPLSGPEKPNETSLPADIPVTLPMWKPPTQEDISKLLVSSEIIQSKTPQTLFSQTQNPSQSDTQQQSSIYVKRSENSPEQQRGNEPLPNLDLADASKSKLEIENQTETSTFAKPTAEETKLSDSEPSVEQQTKPDMNERIDQNSTVNSFNTSGTTNTSIFGPTPFSTNNYSSTNHSSLVTSPPVNVVSANPLPYEPPYSVNAPPLSIPSSIATHVIPSSTSYLLNLQATPNGPMSQVLVSTAGGLYTTCPMATGQVGQSVTYSVLPHYNTLLPDTLQQNIPPSFNTYHPTGQLGPQASGMGNMPTLLVNTEGKIIAPLPPGAQLLPGFVPPSAVVTTQASNPKFATQVQEPQVAEPVSQPQPAPTVIPTLSEQIQEVARKMSKTKSQNQDYKSIMVCPASTGYSGTTTTPPPPPPLPFIPPPPPPPPPPLPPMTPTNGDSSLAKVLRAHRPNSNSPHASLTNSRRSSNSTGDSDSMKGLQLIQRDDILAARSSLRSRKDQNAKPVDKPQINDPHEKFQKELSEAFLMRKQKNGDSMRTKLPNGKNITVGRALDNKEVNNGSNRQETIDRRKSLDDYSNTKTLTYRRSSQSSNSSSKFSVNSNSSQNPDSRKLEKTSVIISQPKTSPQETKKTVWRTNIDVHRSSSLKEKEQQSWTPEQDLEDFEEKETLTGDSDGQRTLTTNGFKANLLPGNIKPSRFQNNKKDENSEKAVEENEKPLIVWKSEDSLLDGSVNMSSNWSFRTSESSDIDSSSQTKSKRKIEKKTRKKDDGGKKSNRFSFPPVKTKDNSEKSNASKKTAGGIVYGPHGEIVFLPGFQTAENDHVIDEDAGKAPKWRSKKKKYAFQSTVKLNERERLELELASRVQARERQMEEERIAQQRTEMDFRRMRMYINYPDESRNTSASVSRTNSSHASSSRDVSRSTSVEGESRQAIHQTAVKETEFFPGSDDRVVLQQVKSIAGANSTNVTQTSATTTTQPKKQDSKSGTEQVILKDVTKDSRLSSGFEKTSNRLPKEKQAAPKTNYPGLIQPNYPNAGFLSNPALGTSLPNLAFLNDYLKLLNATQTMVPPLYQPNLNPALYGTNPNLVQGVNPYYPFFINPMVGDPNNILGGLGFNQVAPNGVQNPMYTSDDSADDDDDDTESLYQSIRNNHSNYTSSCSSDQTKDLDNSYSTQSSSVAYTSTEYKSSDSGNQPLASETEISTQSSSISSIDR